MERTYAAFISYRHAPLDITTAKTLHSLIEQYRVPKSLRKNGQKRLGIVFRDQDELSASSDLTANICRALDHTEFLIVICTPDSKKSPWVEREINYFLQHHDRSRVLSVLAAGEPDEAFPLPLTQRRDPETEEVEVIEPLAVDIRAKDEKSSMAALRREVKRLFAAMLGCPYDALILREQKRKRRRIMGFMSAALAVAVSFSAMLMVKNRQIDQKNLELEDKNEELAQQRADVLLRESELLTQNADDALEQADYLGAVESAVSALPGGTEVDRPYYADAERSLLSALDLFGSRSESYAISSTQIHQMTPIEDYYVNQDGTKVITMDPYNLLCCYDTRTAQLLWSTHDHTGAAFYSAVELGRLFPCEAHNAVVAYYSGSFTAYDISTGSVLWTQTDSGAVDEYQFISDDGERLVYCRQFIQPDLSSVDYDLILLDLATGEILNQIPVTDGVSMFGAGFIVASGQASAAGAFSADGSQFAGLYFLEREDEGYDPIYFLADLDSGSCETIFVDEPCRYYSLYDVAFLSMSGDGTTLLVGRRPEDTDVAIALTQLSLQTGEVLWQSQAPAEESGYFSSASFCSLISTNYAYVGRGDKLYCFSRHTGELLAQSTASGDLLTLFFVGDNFMGYATDDGYYALCWRNSAGFYDSSYFGATARLGQVDRVIPWGDGIIQAAVEDNSITGMTLTSEAGQFMAVQPQDDSASVLIKRVVDLSVVRQAQSVETVSDGARLYTPKIQTLSQGLLAIGGYSDDYGITYYAALIEPQTHSAVQAVHVDTSASVSYLLLADGSGYILDDGWGNVSVCAVDGEQQTLSEGENVVLSAAESSATFIASRVVSGTCLRSADEVLLSACCDGETLSIWLDGQSRSQVTLPEDLTSQYYTTAFIHRIFEVGPNGYILLSHFGDLASTAVTGFAAYDTLSGSWTRFDDGARGTYERELCMGNTLPCFAIIDADGMARIYDMSSGTLTGEFSLQMPYNSFSQLEFILDDQYLMAKTEDMQLLIYDVSDGTIVYRQQLQTADYTDLLAFADEENNRLYIADESITSHPNGLCLDTTTWTRLAELDGLICYVAQTNEVYLYSSYSGLTAYYVPSTAELVELGKSLLGQ